METRIINNNEKDAWNLYVDSHTLSIAWHRWEWKDLLEKHYDFEYYPIAAFSNGDIQGILPLYKTKTSPKKYKLISVPYAVAGGILSSNSEAEQLLLENATTLSREHENCPIVFKQYKKKIHADLVCDENYYNKELLLQQGIDTIWNNLDAVNKQNIEIGKALNPQVEFPSKNIDAFYQILFDFHHKQGIPCVSKSWIKSLVDSGMYIVALVRTNNTLVAGTMIKEFKKTISLPFSCYYMNNPSSCSALYFLYWELMQHYIKNKFEICHSGRIPNTDETLQFRLGWGGEKHCYFYQYYPKVSSQGTEFATKRGKKRALISKLWKRLPAVLAKQIGPQVVRYFP